MFSEIDQFLKGLRYLFLSSYLTEPGKKEKEFHQIYETTYRANWTPYHRRIVEDFGIRPNSKWTIRDIGWGEESAFSRTIRIVSAVTLNLMWETSIGNENWVAR